MARESAADQGITQFVAPKTAVDAINVQAIQDDARARGIERPNIELDTNGAEPGKIRVTCGVTIATQLVRAWKNLADDTPTSDGATHLLDDLADAIGAAAAAIVEAQRPRERPPLIGDIGDTV